MTTIVAHHPLDVHLFVARSSADQVDFSGQVRRHLWILSVGYAHGPDDLAVLLVWSEAAPLGAEGLNEEKSAAALGA